MEEVLLLSVSAQFALTVGSEILREDKLPSPLPSLGTPEGIDGALILQIGDHPFIDERYWDRVDALLAGTLAAVRSARAGVPGEAEFPDTRVVLSISSVDGDTLRLTLENVSVDAPTAALESALVACGQRLLTRAGSLAGTPALRKLADLVAGD